MWREEERQDITAKKVKNRDSEEVNVTLLPPLPPFVILINLKSEIMHK